jgi:hypothetical protein
VSTLPMEAICAARLVRALVYPALKKFAVNAMLSAAYLEIAICRVEVRSLGESENGKTWGTGSKAIRENLIGP